MSLNPINLALRFFLELIGLYAYGYWGWTQNSGILRWILAIGLPVLAATLWGTFRWSGDQTGKAPVQVAGILRLLLEAIYFGGAVWAFYAAGRSSWGLAFGIVILLHYIASYDRITRMIKN